MQTLAIVLAVLALSAGCAATVPAARVDTISFDRGAFGLFWGGFSEITKAACERKKATEAEKCAEFKAQDEVIRKQIITPPAAVAPTSSVDMEQILKMLSTLGKLAL